MDGLRPRRLHDTLIQQQIARVHFRERSRPREQPLHVDVGATSEVAQNRAGVPQASAHAQCRLASGEWPPEKLHSNSYGRSCFSCPRTSTRHTAAPFFSRASISTRRSERNAAFPCCENTTTIGRRSFYSCLRMNQNDRQCDSGLAGNLDALGREIRRGFAPEHLCLRHVQVVQDCRPTLPGARSAAPSDGG